MGELFTVPRRCPLCGLDCNEEEFVKGRNYCRPCKRAYDQQRRKQLLLTGPRKCTICGAEKDAKQFSCGNQCKACLNQRGQENNKNPHRNIPRTCRICGIYKAAEAFITGKMRCKSCDAVERNLSKYGLTTEREQALLDKQNYKCPMCRRKFSQEVIMCRDHSHELGHFRGFLCQMCNTIEGMARATGDPIRTLKRLVDSFENEELFNSISNKGKPIKCH
jgi:hypothetical protein